MFLRVDRLDLQRDGLADEVAELRETLRFFVEKEIDDARAVDWHTLPGANIWFVPRYLLNGIGALDAVSHELVGLFVYWITGRSSELFPGPLPAAKPNGPA